MVADTSKSGTSAATGLLSGLVSVATNGVGLLVSRLELATLELAEVRDHVIQLILPMLLALIAIWFAIAYGTALIVYLSWPGLGWKILGLMAMGFALIAAGLLLHVRRLVRQGKFSLTATMVELKADRDMLL